MQENTDFWHAADSLALLTESLYESWVLQPERRRDAESMKEAGLGVVDALTPAASATPGVTTPATGAQVGGYFTSSSLLHTNVAWMCRVDSKEYTHGQVRGRAPSMRHAFGSFVPGLIIVPWLDMIAHMPR